MKTFTVEIIADSINPEKNRITTFLLTYPRFIHSELLTHRTFSRNAASSRAIPIEKVIQQVLDEPAKPVRWGKNGKGMQDHGEFTGQDIAHAQSVWRYAAMNAINSAKALNALGLHKQIVNRVLEPFVWMTTLITSTEWQNFFSLRVHEDAQPEFQHLAYLMLKAYLGNQPEHKRWGEWHIPFGDRMPADLDEKTKFKVATARAARTSYLTMDGQIDVAKDVELHDRLAESGHWSPFEHVAQSSFAQIGCGNFKHWRQYRHLFPNENRTCDLRKLLEDYEKKIATDFSNAVTGNTHDSLEKLVKDGTDKT